MAGGRTGSVGLLWPDDVARLAIAVGIEQVGRQGLFGGVEVSAFNRMVFPLSRPQGAPARQLIGSGLIGARGVQQKRVVPFLSGGPSLVTNPDECCGPGLGWTFGGGADFWATRHLGVRLESRVVRPWWGEGGFSVVRVGLVVR